MKKSSIIAGLALILTLTGCNARPVTSVPDAVSSESSGEIISSAETSEEDGGLVWSEVQEDPEPETDIPTRGEVQAQYPDKTVLVWFLDDLDETARTRLLEANEYLDAQGCDFVFCLEEISAPFSAGNFPDNRAVGIKNALAEGKNVDIVQSRVYHEFVTEGLFEPLDKYLENTETGKKLFELMPQNYWEGLRADGSIYGVSGSLGFMLSTDDGYLVNDELAEKYGYDVNKSILEQLDILKTVKENETGCAPYLSDRLLVPLYFTNIKDIGEAVYWDSETHSAKCVLDNAEYTEKLRFLDTLNKEGVLSRNWEAPAFFIVSANRAGAAFGYDKNETVEYNYNGKIIRAIPVFNGQTYMRSSPYMVTGVCSGSRNKDKAFELLALTQTDPYLSNLLSFGVESEDYTLADGKVDRLENPANPGYFANILITHSYEGISPAVPKTYYSAAKYREILEKANLFEDHDFYFDDSGMIDELNATGKIIDEFKLPENGKSLDDALAELRAELEDAGMQKIIDECNRQYEVYKNEKN